MYTPKKFPAPAWRLSPQLKAVPVTIACTVGWSGQWFASDTDMRFSREQIFKTKLEAVLAAREKYDSLAAKHEASGARLEKKRAVVLKQEQEAS